MLWQKVFGKANQWGSDALIAGTQLLSERKLLPTPDLSTQTLGQGAWTYRVQRDWSRADAQRLPVNNCHEMVCDKAGRLFLLTDEPRNNILVFNADGNVLDHWTLGLAGAHGLTIAAEGDREALWICDPYSARVLKTTLDGQVLMELPGPHALGIYSALQAYAPTQTAVAANGDVYVADGYGSQYVIQFNADGEYIRHFGGKGKSPASLDFAHGIAIDARQGAGNEILLVTSRRASMLRQFSLHGEHVGDIHLPGGYPCRPVVHGRYVYVSLCWSGAHLRPNSGFIVVLDERNVVCATLGGHAEWSTTGNLTNLVSDYNAFHHVHDVCITAQGDIYACEWNAGQRYPIKLIKHQ